MVQSREVMGRVVNIFYCPKTMQLLRSRGVWRIPFAHGRAYVVFELTEMNMARMGERDGIGVFAGFVCFAGMGKVDTMGLGESTWHGLNSKN